MQTLSRILIYSICLASFSTTFAKTFEQIDVTIVEMDQPNPHRTYFQAIPKWPETYTEQQRSRIEDSIDTVMTDFFNLSLNPHPTNFFPTQLKAKLAFYVEDYYFIDVTRKTVTGMGACLYDFYLSQNNREQNHLRLAIETGADRYNLQEKFSVFLENHYRDCRKTGFDLSTLYSSSALKVAYHYFRSKRQLNSNNGEPRPPSPFLDDLYRHYRSIEEVISSQKRMSTLASWMNNIARIHQPIAFGYKHPSFLKEADVSSVDTSAVEVMLAMLASNVDLNDLQEALKNENLHVLKQAAGLIDPLITHCFANEKLNRQHCNSKSIAKTFLWIKFTIKNHSFKALIRK